MNGFFVTGTDTGVGKTTISVALLTAATKMGLSTAAIKPAESGCTRLDGGRLQPADALALLQASSSQSCVDEVCCYRFEEPVAPGVAAARTGRPIELAPIERLVTNAMRGRPDLLLVEGAGGLLVPLGPSWMIADLAVALQLPLIIVARAGLGTINHTLLTLAAARERGLDVAGVVFSCASSPVDEVAIRTNAEEITRAHAVPYLGCLPHLPSSSPVLLADALAQQCPSLLSLAST